MQRLAGATALAGVALLHSSRERYSEVPCPRGALVSGVSVPARADSMSSPQLRSQQKIRISARPHARYGSRLKNDDSLVISSPNTCWSVAIALSYLSIRLAAKVAAVKHDLTIEIAHLTAFRARSDSPPRKFSFNYKVLLHRVTRATQPHAFFRSRAVIIHRII